MEQLTILNRLLDKFETSKHLMQPGVSNRRVMLRVEKKELPEYLYENVGIRDRYNQAATTLSNEGVISIEWLAGRSVMFCITLLLYRVDAAYCLAGRVHPAIAAERAAALINEALINVKAPWICAWAQDTCMNIKDTWRLPGCCKHGDDFLREFLCALRTYDQLRRESITMRAFSLACYQDSKRFEQTYLDEFLKVAERFEPELRDACQNEEMSQREKLACLGIYARPELYELSGKFVFHFASGQMDISPTFPFGVAIPSTQVNQIGSIDMCRIRKVTFIENKTNYDEYLVSELQSDELVLFHGGFHSPQKRKFIRKIFEFAPQDTMFYYWADIDLGGFLMFQRLQEIVPNVVPMRMSAEHVARYAAFGLSRSKEYLAHLQKCLDQHVFPPFEEAIKEILCRGITIEQEAFLKD